MLIATHTLAVLRPIILSCQIIADRAHSLFLLGYGYQKLEGLLSSERSTNRELKKIVYHKFGRIKLYQIK